MTILGKVFNQGKAKNSPSVIKKYYVVTTYTIKFSCTSMTTIQGFYYLDIGIRVNISCYITELY